MEGSSLLNLEVFEKLVGGEALQNVVLATTMWDTAHFVKVRFAG
jgi:hypothetical protein